MIGKKQMVQRSNMIMLDNIVIVTVHYWALHK